MQSVALIDYGSGNLRSAEKALVRAADGRADIVVTHDPAVVASADRIVLPGVGAFAACMAALSEREGVIEAMNHAVHDRGVPFLGICVGLQLMASRGLEFGVTPGLGWIDGERMKKDYELVQAYLGMEKPFDVTTAFTTKMLDPGIKMDAGKVKK